MPFVKERITTLTQAVDLLRFLFTDDLEPSDEARALMEQAGPDHLRAAADALTSVEEWTLPEVESALQRLQEASGMSRTKAWQPIRAAVTGSAVSPPLDASIYLVGRERCVARLRASAEALASRTQA
jgi:glutamyl-tRNA synthetase